MSNYIDVHCHFDSYHKRDYLVPAEIAVEYMDRYNVQGMGIVQFPFVDDNYTIYKQVIHKYSGRFRLLTGSEPTVLVSTSKWSTMDQLERDHEMAKLDVMLSNKYVPALGEMMSLHISLKETHPYYYAPLSHPVYPDIVDLASLHKSPIDIHMEAVPEGGIATPQWLLDRSPKNPDRLPETMPGLYILMNYASIQSDPPPIIWSHLGWDCTGYRGVELCDSLLGMYSNLYMSIRIPSYADITESVRIVDTKGLIKPEWMDLFEKYPDRFMMGADHFFREDIPDELNSFVSTWGVIDQFNPDLRELIGRENAVRIFKL